MKDRNNSLAHVNGITNSFQEVTSLKKLQEVTGALNSLQKHWLATIEGVLQKQDFENVIDEADIKLQIEDEIFKNYNISGRDIADIANKQYGKATKLFTFSEYFKQNYI